MTHVFTLFQVGNELANIARVGGKIERQNVGVSKTQSQYAPQLRHQGVIAIARIAEMVHPVKIVVHRVVDAIVTVEAEPDHGHPHEIQEHGMVGTAADSCVCQIRRR